MKKLTERDYRISNWSGGKTIQLAIAPVGAEYADRDFLWRLSSATVNLYESDFTALPDYMRLIAPISGKMRLMHNGGKPVDILPYETHRFDGADNTHSRGCCTDFNLMLRKGVCDGCINAVKGDAAENQVLCPVPGVETMLIYCTEGRISVSSGDERVELNERETAILQGGFAGTVTLTFTENSRALTAQVWRTDGRETAV